MMAEQGQTTFDFAPMIQYTARQRMFAYKMTTMVSLVREASTPERKAAFDETRSQYTENHVRVSTLGPVLNRAEVHQALDVIGPFAAWIASATPDSAMRLDSDDVDDLVLRRVPKQIAALNVIIGALEDRVREREDTARSDRVMASGIAGELQMVAGKINLIALNARIEAARQGDAGRAFSVIANEIKALSDDSRVKADEIALRLGGDAMA